jgi:hypothetical protein
MSYTISSLFKFTNQDVVCISDMSHTCVMSRRFNLPLFDRFNGTWWRALVVMAGDFVKALYLQSIVTVAQLVRSFTLLRPPCGKSLFWESTSPSGWVAAYWSTVPRAVFTRWKPCGASSSPVFLLTYYCSFRLLGHDRFLKKYSSFRMSGFCMLGFHVQCVGPMWWARMKFAVQPLASTAVVTNAIAIHLRFWRRNTHTHIDPDSPLFIHLVQEACSFFSWTNTYVRPSWTSLLLVSQILW